MQNEFSCYEVFSVYCSFPAPSFLSNSFCHFAILQALVFSAVGKRTPIAARWSTVGGESGSADTARDPRGFAVKFYTEEGNWDLVGNNTPIFFIR